MRGMFVLGGIILALCIAGVLFVLGSDDASISPAADPAAKSAAAKTEAGPSRAAPTEAAPKATRGRDERPDEPVEAAQLLSISGVVQIDGGESPLAGATVRAYAWDSAHAGVTELMEEVKHEFESAFSEEDVEDLKDLEAESDGEDHDGDGKPDAGVGVSIKLTGKGSKAAAKASKKGMEAIQKAGGVGKLMDAALGALGSEAKDPDFELRATTTSGEDGTFRIDGLAPGVYELRATAPGYVRARLRIAAGEEGAVLKLPIGARLDGIVMCEGQALADVTVWTDGAKTVTDDGGRFAFDGVRMPKAWLLLTAKGYVAKTHPVELEPGVENSVETIVLQPAGSVAGFVRDASGKPMAGVRVSLDTSNAMADLMALATQMGGGASAGAPKTPDVFAETDANGAYLLENVNPGTRTIVAEHSGFLTSRRKEVVVEKRETTAGIDFALLPEAVLVGQVTGPEGQPLVAASVSVKVPEDAGGFAGMMSAMLGGKTEDGTADGSGNYRVTKLPAGELEVTVSAVGFLKSRETVTLAAGLETRRDFQLREGHKIAGRVLTPDGEPLAHADVEVEWPRAEGEGNPMMDMWLGGASEDFETDAEGRFLASGLQEGPYTVTADHADYLPVKLERVEAGSMELEVALGLAATVRGVVLSEVDGTPLADVQVTAEGGKRPRPANPMMAMLSVQGEQTESGADGSFTLRGLYPGKYRVWGRVRGYADSERVRLEVVAGDAIDDVTVVMPPGESLGGKIVDTGGAPVNDALVFISRSKNPWAANAADMGIGEGSRISPPPESIYAYSNGDGTYELTGLSPGRVTVEVRSRDHAPLTKRGVQVPGGDLDLELSAGGQVMGIVLDAEGEPKAGAQVMIMKGMGVGQRMATTDADGRYLLENIAPGAYMMLLLDLDGAEGMSFGDMKFKNVSVRDGETTEQDFKEETSGKPVTGVVIANGKPVANSMVVLTGGSAGMKMEQTGDDGRFTFKGVAPGEYTVMVQRNMMGGAATSRKVTVEEEGDVAEVRLEFSSLALRGKVVDEETGEPVASAQIVVSEAGGRSSESLSEMIEQTRGQGFTGTDGTFELEGMPEGAFTVRVTAAGYAGTHVDDVRPGTPVTIKLSRGVELEVAVTDTEGNPIPGASIQADDAAGRESLAFDISFQGMTDAEGVARVRMHPGRYTLHVQAEGYPEEKVEVSAEQGTITVKLRAGGRLEVEVVDGAGKPVLGAAVVVKDKDGKLVRRRVSMSNAFGTGVLTDAQGRLALESLPTGTVTVSVTYPNDTSRVAEDTAKIPSGGTARIKLTLP